MYWSLPLKEERAGYLLENLIKALKPYALQLLPDRPIGIEALITSVLALILDRLNGGSYELYQIK